MSARIETRRPRDTIGICQFGSIRMYAILVDTSLQRPGEGAFVRKMYATDISADVPAWSILKKDSLPPFPWFTEDGRGWPVFALATTLDEAAPTRTAPTRR